MKYLTPDVPDGTFLIRLPSDPKTCKYVLCVKCKKLGDRSHVCHYKIYFFNQEFYISVEIRFPTLAALIEAYTINDGLGICTRLTEPCIKTEVPQKFDLSPKLSIDWEIPREELQLLDIIGEGHFSTVRRGLWRNKTIIAVKAVENVSKQRRKQFMTEFQVMKKLRHRNIISLYGVCTLEEPILIIQEYAEGGSLLDHLKNRDLRITQNVAIIIAHQIAKGMAYVEARNIVHRDLAARNVLLDGNLNAKISDFGLSRMLIDSEYRCQHNVLLPLRWTAPEALLNSKFTTKSDVWSYGVLLTEIFDKGRTPYRNVPTELLLNFHIQGKNMEKPESMPDDIYQCCLKCWTRDPDRRPTFHELQCFLGEHS